MSQETARHEQQIAAHFTETPEGQQQQGPIINTRENRGRPDWQGGAPAAGLRREGAGLGKSEEEAAADEEEEEEDK